jgi:hypothetical protein
MDYTEDLVYNIDTSIIDPYLSSQFNVDQVPGYRVKP